METIRKLVEHRTLSKLILASAITGYAIYMFNKATQREICSSTVPGTNRTIQQDPYKLLKAMPALTIGNSGKNLTVDNFLNVVLQWKPKWLDEMDAQEGAAGAKSLPPIMKFAASGPSALLKSDTLWPVPDTFENVEEYFETMLGHILHEVWASTYSDWRTSKNRPTVVSFIPVSKGPDDTVVFQGLVGSKQQVPMSEGDLVIVHTKRVRRDRSPSGIQRVFGYVQRTEKTEPLNREQLNPKLGNFNRVRDTKRMVVSLTIRFFYNIRRDNEFVDIQKQYNSSQVRVINSVVASLLQPFAVPHVSLIQGPPGTGKSHTILAIIQNTIFRKTADGRTPCLMLCAPSNAAVDELVRRVSIENDIRKQQGKEMINLVRIGRELSMSKNSRQYSLDTKVMAAWMKCFHDNLNLTVNTDMTRIVKAMAQPDSGLEIRDRMWLKITIPNAFMGSDLVDWLHSHVEGFADRRDTQKYVCNLLKAGYIHHTVNKLTFSEQCYYVFGDLCGAKRGRYPLRPTSRDRSKLRYEVLAQAHIVACTLNSAGSRVITDAVALGQTHMYKGPRFQFTGVLIDEACQCVEVEALIPLQYCATKLVLIGDPQQLPPTVISQDAKKMKFSQSLFERLYNYFGMEGDSPVFLLDTQYRMHPEIATFPSEHIYNGRLKTDPELADKGSLFPFRPYFVFDLEYGRERLDRSMSVSNPAEVEFVLSLVRYLTSNEVKPIQIGIITPYNKQKYLLQDQLRSCKLQQVDVGTVDGFQGQEKDIIIMSCVRACSRNNKIGFVADKRRMNVALTRAKYGCYVVGHLDSLLVDPDWGALVEDAVERQVVLSVEDSSVQNLLIHDGLCQTYQEKLPT